MEPSFEEYQDESAMAQVLADSLNALPAGMYTELQGAALLHRRHWLKAESSRHLSHKRSWASQFVGTEVPCQVASILL